MLRFASVSSKLAIVYQFYSCFFEILFCFFTAKGLKLYFPLFDEAGLWSHRGRMYIPDASLPLLSRRVLYNETARIKTVFIFPTWLTPKRQSVLKNAEFCRRLIFDIVRTSDARFLLSRSVKGQGNWLTCFGSQEYLIAGMLKRFASRQTIGNIEGKQWMCLCESRCVGFMPLSISH